MSWKHLFARSLAADPGRLHFAAHSHHLWPDASRDGQIAAWDDAALLADRKWGRVMGEVWPEAQRHVAAELHLPDPGTVVFASNTHDLLVRLVSAVDRRPVRILASDGEFHSFRRQAARWIEAGVITLETIAADAPDFEARFVERAAAGNIDLVFVSHVMFGSGRVFGAIEALAALARPEGPWVAIDGYHGFMATPVDLSGVADRVFYLAGGYKYAMAGEGAGLMHAPPGFGERPAVTGWYASFGELEAAGQAVGYAADGARFMGATFDPSGLYRFNAVRAMLAREGITTERASRHVAELQDAFLSAAPLGGAALLNPPIGSARARFLAFRTPEATAINRALAEAGIVTDVRGDVLRIGFGIYHDRADVARLVAALR